MTGPRSLPGDQGCAWRLHHLQGWSHSGWLCLHHLQDGAFCRAHPAAGDEKLSGGVLWGKFWLLKAWGQPCRSQLGSLRSSRQPGGPFWRWRSGSVVAETTFLTPPHGGVLVPLKSRINEDSPVCLGAGENVKGYVSNHWLLSFLLPGHTPPRAHTSPQGKPDDQYAL